MAGGPYSARFEEAHQTWVVRDTGGALFCLMRGGADDPHSGLADARRVVDLLNRTGEMSTEDLRAELRRRGLTAASDAFWQSAAELYRRIPKLEAELQELKAGFERAAQAEGVRD
jgi:hypothetical protein